MSAGRARKPEMTVREGVSLNDNDDGGPTEPETIRIPVTNTKPNKHKEKGTTSKGEENATKADPAGAGGGGTRKVKPDGTAAVADGIEKTEHDETAAGGTAEAEPDETDAADGTGKTKAHGTSASGATGNANADDTETGDLEEEEDEEDFIVEAILDKKTVGGVVKYLMKWQGYDE